MRRMKIMGEKMKEVELSLRNVKLLLREKDAHLKEQVRSTAYTGTERVNGVVFSQPCVCACTPVHLLSCHRLSDSSSCRRMGKRTC